MNRFFLLFLLAMMLFAVSCAKWSLSPAEESDSKTVSIHPQISRLPATKVSLQENAADFYNHAQDPFYYGSWDPWYPMDWDANDAIWVINARQPERIFGYTFTGSYWFSSGEDEVEKDPSVTVQQFYGVYPQKDISITSVKQVTADSTYATVSATIPDVQSISKDYYLMTSAVDVSAQADSIVMPFNAVNTVIRVGFANRSGRSVILRSMSLSSDWPSDILSDLPSDFPSDLPLAGTFVANISTNGYVEYLDPDGDGDISDSNKPRSNTISLDLGEDDLILEPMYNGDEYIFKEFYILPQKYMILTLKLQLEVDGDLRAYEKKIIAQDDWEVDENGIPINWVMDPADPGNQFMIDVDDYYGSWPACFFTPGKLHFVEMRLY